jgi:hypothetical protein
VLALLGAIAVARAWALSMAAVLLVMAALIEVIQMEEVAESGGDVASAHDVGWREDRSEAGTSAAIAPSPPPPPPTPASPEDGRVLVTFRLPACVEAGQASVVGEFNGWNPTVDVMARGAAGFTATVLLEPGRTYRYRYLLDGDRWENDWSAHAYVPNGFGEDDSLLDLTGDLTAEAPPAPEEDEARWAGAEELVASPHR